MNLKKIVTGVSAAALTLAMALPVMAATFTNVAFQNNQTTVDCTAGATKNVVFRLDVPAGQTVEKVQVDVLGDNMAPMTPFDVGGELGLQEGIHDVNASVTCPQNTGYYNVEVRGAGIFGGQRAISISDVNAVISVNTFTNALRVVSHTTSNSGGSLGNINDKLDEMLAKLLAIFTAKPTPAPDPTPAPTPAVNAKCTAIAPYRTAPQGTYSAAGVQLQSALLLDNPMAIPALKPGSSVPMGFRGVQTEAALSAYLSMYQCI